MVQLTNQARCAPTRPPPTSPTRPIDRLRTTRPTLCVPPTRLTPHHPPSRPRLLHPDRSTLCCPPDPPPPARPRATASSIPHLPPLMNASSCSASRRPATGECPYLVCPSASVVGAHASSDPVPHKMTKEITKWLSKPQNDRLLYQNPKTGCAKF
jgi:hypothetical protein